MCIEKKVIRYAGQVIQAGTEEVILPNGEHCELEVVYHPGGAAVVAVNDKQQVCLLRQYRHVAGGWLWELPAGKIDNQEPPQETARRELREEAGIEAVLWQSLGEIISSPGVFKEVVSLYLVQQLKTVPQALEAQELIEVHWVPFTQALEWARTGEIRDAKTVIGLFRAEPLLC